MSDTAGSKGLSLEYRLPFLITALLLLLVVAGTLTTYRLVRESAIERNGERLERVATQLASLVEASVSGRVNRMREVAADPDVRALLTGDGGADPNRARDALLGLIAPGDSVLTVALRGADGERLLIARDLPPDWSPSRVDSVLQARMPPPGGGYSPIVRIGEERFNWVTAPLEIDGARRGEVSLLRRVGVMPNAQELRNLIGLGSGIYFPSGESWITLEGEFVAAPGDTRLGEPWIYRDAGGMERLAYAAVVGAAGGASFPVIVDAPMSEVLATPRRLARSLLLGAFLFMIPGITAGWWVSRDITGPVKRLARASSIIAGGDYSVRVDVSRHDELGDLGRSFNGMAGEIDAANRALSAAVALAEQARADAEAANRAKSDFVAILSHELRTPINAILGYTNLLHLQISGPLNQKQEAQLERIRASGGHLTSLIDEILDLARIEAGKFELTRVPGRLADRVDGAVEAVVPDASAKQIQLRRVDDPDVWFEGDARRVSQILLNLLVNAIKFTPPGGTVEVGTRSEGGVAVATVRDTGPGVAPELAEQIFEPFVRAEGSTAHTGVGLGLAISRRLARAMGGDVTVQSVPNGGSTFTLRLPLAAAAEPQLSGEKG